MPTPKDFIKRKEIASTGFTLVELLLVVVLISILSGVILSVLNVAGLRARSRDAQRTGDLKKIQTALELYYTDYRGYPANSGGWLLIDSTVTAGNAVETNIVPAYTQRLPQDPMTGQAMTAPVCGSANFGYYYRTDACSGSPCRSAKYVLRTAVESPGAADNNLCSSLLNCSNGSVAGCAACGAPCYGVESQL